MSYQLSEVGTESFLI